MFKVFELAISVDLIATSDLDSPCHLHHSH
jgi:hypothetical protein